NMSIILVQIADEKWTMEALHLACALARSTGAQVALLRLIQVRHLSYLGTSFGNTPPDNREYQLLKEYAATAEDYGVPLTIQSMRCVSVMDALVEAVDQLESVILFAHIAPTRISYWRRFQVWNLGRRLALKRCQLFTLDQPVGFIKWMPAVTVRAIVSDKPHPSVPHVPVQDKHP
ncbi:MAG: hypothetical protein K8I30_14315, partial [Anaerolineae bacterium]|nr:hypothetical protein [Anaerolineae bacterium]